MANQGGGGNPKGAPHALLTLSYPLDRACPALDRPAPPDASIEFFLQASMAPNTIAAYRSDLRAYLAQGGTIPATGRELAGYLASQASRLSPYTLSRRLSALRRVHRALGFEDPGCEEIVRGVMRGIWRRVGRVQKQARPLLHGELAALVDAIGSDKKGCRDRALLLLGFRAALRRSELVALNVEDFCFSDEGLLIVVRRSKTDQEGHGRTIAIPHASALCAVQALRNWLDVSEITTGAAFRNLSASGHLTMRLAGQSVGTILRRHAASAGLETTGLSAHSLRAGFVTSAARAGSAVQSIQKQTGHKSIGMVYRYVRASSPFAGNANTDLDGTAR